MVITKAAWDTHPARSDKKRTLEFICEIKTKVDNDPSKSMRATARDTGVSEFHIGQTVHEDIRYFSYKMDKRQQDAAPCHASRGTLAWLPDNSSDHFTPDMWPPNSPDCNPLSYCVWGEVERRTNTTPCNTKDELRARIMATLTNINKETVQKSSRRLQSRLEVVVKASGISID